MQLVSFAPGQVRENGVVQVYCKAMLALTTVHNWEISMARDSDHWQRLRDAWLASHLGSGPSLCRAHPAWMKSWQQTPPDQQQLLFPAQHQERHIDMPAAFNHTVLPLDHCFLACGTLVLVTFLQMKPDLIKPQTVTPPTRIKGKGPSLLRKLPGDLHRNKVSIRPSFSSSSNTAKQRADLSGTGATAWPFSGFSSSLCLLLPNTPA